LGDFNNPLVFMPQDFPFSTAGAQNFPMYRECFSFVAKSAITH